MGDLLGRHRSGEQLICRVVYVRELNRESLSPAADGGCRIIQLVGQSGGELAQRQRLLVALHQRGKAPRAIQHEVHQQRRDLRACVDQLGDDVPGHHEHLHGGPGNGVTHGVTHA
jgi:hypothetical protein